MASTAEQIVELTEQDSGITLNDQGRALAVRAVQDLETRHDGAHLVRGLVRIDRIFLEYGER